MAAQKCITVSSRTQLDNSISQYIAKGFTVANRSERSVTMQKPKQFSIPIALIGLLFFVAPLVIYAVFYAMKPAAEVVEINIS